MKYTKKKKLLSFFLIFTLCFGLLMPTFRTEAARATGTVKEPSAIITKDGRVRNGSLIYTIRPIQEAMELNYQRQFLQAERDMERAKAEKRLAELNRQNEKKEEESA